MKIINLVDIGEYPDDLVLAKIDIEQNFLHLDKRMKISDFIKWLNIKDTIYVWDGEFIPFFYIKVEENEYLFISNHLKDNEINKKIEHNIISKIIDSENNLSAILHKLTNEEIIVQDKPMPKTDYFFINGEIYV